MALGLSLTMMTSCANEDGTSDEAEKEANEQTSDLDETKDDSADEEKAVVEDEKSNETAKEDGTYEGIAPGYGGDIKVSVALDDDGNIEDIDIIEDMETMGVGKVALEEVKDRIVEGQSTDVEAVTGATASSKGLMLATTKALEEADVADDFKEKYEEDREYSSELDTDIVIVGGGGAGLTAAVEATKAGSSVVVVEKNGFVGGNTILSGGIYNAPDPELQEPEGIEDSPELFYEQTYEAGDEVANPELVQILTSDAYDGLEWLESIGMDFENKIGQGAGSLHPRTHFSTKPNGTGFIDAFMENLEDEDATILTETTAEDIIMEDGKAKGIKAKNYDGSDLTINADQAVIVTTGGFAKNTDMVLEYKDDEKWPDLDEDTISTNLDSITGDGITMGQEAGADLVDMDQMQFLYLGIPERGPITGLLKSGAEDDIFVNKEGKRFVREDGRRDVISKAIYDQTDQIMYMIHSSDYFDYEDEDTVTLENEPMKEILETGKYGWVKADTLEELSEKLDIPYDNLKETFEDYNKLVEEDANEDEFGRELFTNKIEKGPFVAVPRTPSLHHTMGGLKIDKESHVLDEDGNEIPGLYAAGEVTGGIHGANRVGGNAVVDLVVFGRIAGQNAAAESK